MQVASSDLPEDLKYTYKAVRGRLVKLAPLCTALLAIGLAACEQNNPNSGSGLNKSQNAESQDQSPAPDNPSLSGGTTTVFDTSSNAYSLPATNIPITQRDRFFVGNAFFKQPWVIAPASTQARDGLGPLYNTNTCQGCHIKDGRGHAPPGGESPAQNESVSLLIRLSVPADETSRESLDKFGALPHPVYGGQLQDQAIPGVKPEGRVHVDYTTKTVQLADGTEVVLRKPEFQIKDWAYGDPGEMRDELMISPRVAPPMIGLGLLELIPEESIRAAADPEDTNGDGISGRVNTVWDFGKNQTALGRFGWKAGQPSVRQQTTAAFAGDMGLTTSRFLSDECTASQTACLQAASGGNPEVSDAILDEVVFYSRHIGVPARRYGEKGKPEQIKQGQALFASSGCAGCHTPRQVTGDSPDSPHLSDQTIYPYTDLLLHDMGEALADHRPEFSASGSEWRTPPLWGIGLAQTVSADATFLHDGRARALLEAILWHGGEAAQAREQVTQMSKTERDALLEFLNSL